jgi:hypothetical protein
MNLAPNPLTGLQNLLPPQLPHAPRHQLQRARHRVPGPSPCNLLRILGAPLLARAAHQHDEAVCERVL